MSDNLSADLQALRIDRTPTKTKRGWKWIIIIMTILVVIAGAIKWLMPNVESRFFRAEVEVTEIALVSPAQAAIVLTSTGYVVPQVTSNVSARIRGRISRVRVKEGDEVKQGQVVAELDNAEQRTAIVAARAKVLTAKARTQNARANLAEVTLQYTRQKSLAEGGAVAEAVVNDLNARVKSLQESVKVAEAEAKAAQAEVDSLTINLQYTTITAPISGKVINKPREVGELVGLGLEADRIVEIADMSSLVVETDVPEARLGSVKMGSPAEIVLDAFAQKRFRGETVDVRPKVNRAKATVIVKVRFIDSTEGVLPDMSARVSFLDKREDENAIKELPKLIVPKNAVTDRNGRKVVFLIDQDVVKETPVSLGPAFGSGYEVVDGPNAGARIVKNPSRELRDGQKIKEKSS